MENLASISAMVDVSSMHLAPAGTTAGHWQAPPTRSFGYAHREHTSGRAGSTQLPAGHSTHILAPSGRPARRDCTVAKPCGHAHTPPARLGLLKPAGAGLRPQLMHRSPSAAGVRPSVALQLAHVSTRVTAS